MSTWERDDIQFPRLLAEICAAGIPEELWDTLQVEMGLTSDELAELFDRALVKWDEIKAKTWGGEYQG